MARISILLFLLVFCSATAMQAQAPAPKPDPEVKKLSVYLGHWTYEGERKPGPWGPGGKFTGERDARWILRGFYLETRQREKGPTGESQSIEIDGYDPANKTATWTVYADDGETPSGVSAFTSGTTETYSGKFVFGGKQYLVRGTDIFAPDLLSFTEKSEFSSDGKTWLPDWEFKATKTQRAAKK
jgi:hypothetical protein